MKKSINISNLDKDKFKRSSEGEERVTSAICLFDEEKRISEKVYCFQHSLKETEKQQFSDFWLRKSFAVRRKENQNRSSVFHRIFPYQSEDDADAEHHRGIEHNIKKSKRKCFVQKNQLKNI